MSYTEAMTIEHQKIVDEGGDPTVAVIPWDDFEAFQEGLAEQEANKIVSLNGKKRSQPAPVKLMMAKLS